MAEMSLRDATKAAKSWRSRFAGMASKHEHMLGTAMRTAEIGIGSLSLGVIQGSRKPGEEVTIFGMPLELATGLTLHGAALFGLGGKYNEHLSNFGDAGVSSYLYLVGRGLGEDWRKKREGGGGAGSDLSDTSGQTFSDRLSAVAAEAA